MTRYVVCKAQEVVSVTQEGVWQEQTRPVWAATSEENSRVWTAGARARCSVEYLVLRSVGIANKQWGRRDLQQAATILLAMAEASADVLAIDLLTFLQHSERERVRNRETEGENEHRTKRICK
jgi:NADH dehydrogenase FAD-containing subunit